MGSNQPKMTEAETAAARKQVLQTVRQTRLGRALLSALGKAQVKIVFSDDVAAAADLGDEKNIYGLFDLRNDTLYVDARAPLHAQLHFFAHEARHALQMQQDRKINGASETASIHLISPVTMLYLTRLREIDADVFAVCFVAQNDLHTGSKHFSEMCKRGGLFAKTDSYSRATLYEAFLENWQAQEVPRDMARSARAVLSAFVQNTALLNAYNNFALHVWEKTAFAAAVEHAQKPSSDYFKSFRAAALQKDKAETPRQIFNKSAEAYGRLLVKSGAPDYLSGIKTDDLAKFISEENAQAHPEHTTNYAYERALENFEMAIKHYTAAPANSNAPAAPRRAKKAGPKP
ncbi:MAG: hypothetical protein Q8K65_07950 [Alphaproteobacteria bacterium]|nr:hypothetical protein [Alphaproteobacteria bacterium]